jgi:hypothetical protein
MATKLLHRRWSRSDERAYVDETACSLATCAQHVWVEHVCARPDWVARLSSTPLPCVEMSVEMCPTLMCNFHRNVHVKSFNKIECVGSCVTFNTHGVLGTCSGHRFQVSQNPVPDTSGGGGKRACPDRPGLPPRNPVSRGGIPPGNGVQSTPNWSR